MNILGLVKGLSFKQLWRITCIAIRNPRFIIPTLKATKQTLAICDSLFGSRHHAHGRENAVRHALWNMLIAKNLYRSDKPLESAMNWAKRITDLHEELVPNNPLEKAMDLHNNSIGRKLFSTNPNLSTNQAVASVLQLEKNAYGITKVSEIKLLKEHLVYLSE